MQRGMITFTPTQLECLKSVLSLSTASGTRLGQLIQGARSENISLEVNREEVESLLDTLPAPTSTDPTVLHEVRTVLTSFLQ